MLSGISSQIGGLIGSVKKTATGQPEEGAAANTEGAQGVETTQDPVDPSASATSPAEGEGNSSALSSATSVLGSVRNHMPTLPTWFGGAKTKEGEANAEGAPAEGAAAAAAVTENQTVEEKVTPDATALEGAEGEKGIEGEEGAGAVGKVKTLGSFLFSSIKGAGQKLKESSILGDFQREHESFLKGRGSKGDVSLAPWAGHPKEEALKEEILSLSTDRRNFVRSPPTGVAFTWDYEEMAPIAKAILKEDPNLEKMRYELVPKVINEENFWRNYFYRVSLLKESMSEDPNAKKQDSVETDEEDAAIEKELNDELKSFEIVEGGKGSKTSALDDKEIDSLLN